MSLDPLSINSASAQISASSTENSTTAVYGEHTLQEAATGGRSLR